MLIDPMPNPMAADLARQMNSVLPAGWSPARCVMAVLHPLRLRAERARLAALEEWRTHLPVGEPERYANDPLEPVFVHVANVRDDAVPRSEDLEEAELIVAHGDFIAEHGAVELWMHDVEIVEVYVKALTTVHRRWHPQPMKRVIP